MTDQDWEDICNQCGLCCFNKIIEDDGTVYTTPIPCKYLDVVNRTCKVYHKRFETGEECVKLTPELVANSIWLPDECAYVQHIRTTTGEEEND